ncbi:UNVERIFIED_CONTAM: Scarecrow-like protein 4 [Sesamum latifolium]|uniref:Scarecrow-like protein 4 n=1 Tax=Sesamum latifolium TaxID=2727402 RepID=A0AAW2XXL6_9LAMI
MLSNISQTEQFHSYGGLNEYDLENLEKKSGFCEGEKWGESDMDMDSFGCGVEFFGDCSAQIYQQQQQFADFGSTLNHLCHDVTHKDSSCADELRRTARVESQKSELIEPEEKRADLFPSASFEILNKYRSRCRRLNGKYMNIPRYDAECKVSCGMSVETIIQFAAEKFIQSDERSVLSHPYPSSVLCHFEEDSGGVQLVQNLLACADKVGEKQYERARNLLLECDRMSSPGGTPVQRLVFYFTEALYEKIDRETGRITPKGLGKKVEDPLQALKSPDTILITFHKELPNFAALIDLEIRKGIQCTILMQALAARSENPIEHLKITAVAIKSKSSIEETGRQLTSFAQSLDLKFSFNIVMVEDILDLKENLFDLDEDEAVAVYAAYTLTNMIGQPDQLEHLIRIIKKCMKNDEKHRCIAERTCFNSAIRNIVAAEGEDRKIRHVGISVWRAFFTHFGFEETELSMSALYQANLVLKYFSSGSSYTFDIDGKSLIIGWKGAPVSSLSAWKFQCPM